MHPIRLDRHDPPAGAHPTAAVGSSAEFNRAAALLLAQNHIRRALEAVIETPALQGAGKPAQAERLTGHLRKQIHALSGEIFSMGMPLLPALVSMKIDIDQRHPVSVDIGLALCALGSKRIARIQSEISGSLSELRTPDIVALLQTCARLGWDQEIDRAITALRPGAEAGHLGEALRWRIQREPWRISDHSADWVEQVRRAHHVASTIESSAACAASLVRSRHILGLRATDDVDEGHEEPAYSLAARMR
jgi:hypothetical protein